MPTAFIGGAKMAGVYLALSLLSAVVYALTARIVLGIPLRKALSLDSAALLAASPQKRLALALSPAILLPAVALLDPYGLGWVAALSLGTLFAPHAEWSFGKKGGWKPSNGVDALAALASLLGFRRGSEWPAAAVLAVPAALYLVSLLPMSTVTWAAAPFVAVLFCGSCLLAGRSARRAATASVRVGTIEIAGARRGVSSASGGYAIEGVRGIASPANLRTLSGLYPTALPLAVRSPGVSLAAAWVAVLSLALALFVLPTLPAYLGVTQGPAAAGAPSLVAEKDGRHNTVLRGRSTYVVSSEEMSSALPSMAAMNEVGGGSYTPATGTILLNSDMFTGLGLDIPPATIGRLTRKVITHEYGHVLFEDYVLDQAGRDWIGVVLVSGPRSYLVRAWAEGWTDGFGVPAEMLPLRDAYDATRAGEGGLRGGTDGYDTYHLSNFHEFFAESYARWMADRPVPAAFDEFFASCFE